MKKRNRLINYENKSSEVVKFLIDERKMTLKDLSAEIGISEYKLKKIISGERDMPLDEIQKICDYFSLPFESFFYPDNGICPGTTKIIRYLDFTKFIHILSTSKLHFSRGNEFEDVFEGKIPEVFLGNIDPQIREEYINSYEKNKSNTYISCWSIAKNESYALWKIFAPNYGIAIQTTAAKLSRLIEHLHGAVYTVQYIDYADPELRVPIHKSALQKNIVRNFFSLKSNVYKYEDEVRAIYTAESKKDICIPILSDFIEKIYVSPSSTPWFLELIKDIVHNKYSLDVDIMLSNIKLK